MMKVDIETGLQKIEEKLDGINKTETVDIMDSLNRVLACDVYSPINIPLYDRSPLDGYAVKADDTMDNSVKRFKVLETVYAGGVPTKPINDGEATRIMTGGMYPEGANTVIRQEAVTLDGDYIETTAILKPFTNYIYAGEDIKKGEKIASAGQKLSSIHIGVIAGTGVSEVEVYSELVIGLLSTGDEIVNYDQTAAPGQIYDSNHVTLVQRLKELGFNNVIHIRSGDNKENIKESFKNLIAATDFVISTGGVSVGAKDYIPAALEEIGGELLFDSVKMKPGSHMVLYTFDKTPVLGLSGNPFAAYATFEIFGRKILSVLSKDSALDLKRVRGISKNSFEKHSRGRRIIRATYDAGNVTFPSKHDSGVMSSMIGSNCFVDIPAGSGPIGPGEEVEIILL